MKTALLIVDVQQALIEGDQACHASDAVIARINTAAAMARAAGSPVVFIQHETPSGPFAHGSPGWQLAPGLQTGPDDLFVRKTTPDAFQRTVLQSLLVKHGVTEVAVCGMQSEFCVDTTTRRAAALGYPVVLVADAHTTNDKAHLSAQHIIAHHNQTLSNIASFGPRIRAVATSQLRFAH